MIENQVDNAGSRPKFGSQHLSDAAHVFEHNAWYSRLPSLFFGAFLLLQYRDDVEWDEAQECEAMEKVLANSAHLISQDTAESLESRACEFWDRFYTQHSNRFFKDRNWLFTEFPELIFQNNSPREPQPSTSASDYPGSAAKFRILEVGCGVGNTVFPVLKANQATGDDVFVYCCDFSETAVQLVQSHESYNTQKCLAFVWDITRSSEEYIPFPEKSLDVIIMIFVLSAISPDSMMATLENLTKYLKPGGVVLFRDYGRLDLAQLRFKNGQCISQNFYVRGDGTRVYFFSQDELNEIFLKVGLQKELNYVDRRLIVNRGKKLKMYRVWIQCRYRKK